MHSLWVCILGRVGGGGGGGRKGGCLQAQADFLIFKDCTPSEWRWLPNNDSRVLNHPESSIRPKLDFKKKQSRAHNTTPQRV